MTLGLLALLAFWTITSAQNATQPAAAAPKTASESARDLSGVWGALPSGRPRSPDQLGTHETLAPEVDEADIFTYRHFPYPMQPWAEEKFNYNKDPANPYYNGRAELNPTFASCTPWGPTQDWQDSLPFEIIQSPKRVLILFESNHEVRQVWTDGRPHPKDFGHNWMGHSIGHWEGNTLVVDTIGLNDKTWLDKAGHVHSDQLHLIERLTRIAPDRLLLNITIDDPKAFTMPWSTRRTYKLEPTWDIEEGLACGYGTSGVPLRP
jgi:hypothetical protein